MAIENNFWNAKRIKGKRGISPVQPIEEQFEAFHDDLAESKNGQSFQEVIYEMIAEDEDEDIKFYGN